MLRRMPRNPLPTLLLVSAALAGCDLVAKLKGEADAGDAGTPVGVAAVDAAAAPPTAAPTAEPPPTAATATTLPTGPTPTAAPTAKPVDAGAPKDAGAAPKDGGPAPAPTPTLNLPNLFDGGGIKFDAGGFKPPWVK